MLGLSCMIVLVILTVAVLPTWPYSTSWGFYPSGMTALILFAVLILFVVGLLHCEAPRPPVGPSR